MLHVQFSKTETGISKFYETKLFTFHSFTLQTSIKIVLILSALLSAKTTDSVYKIDSGQENSIQNMQKDWDTGKIFIYSHSNVLNTHYAKCK